MYCLGSGYEHSESVPVASLGSDLSLPKHYVRGGAWIYGDGPNFLLHRTCVRIGVMGSNRRYGSDVTDQAINEAVTRPRPISLTPAEIGQLDVIEPPKPEPVKAWVRYPETPVQVEARAIAWTERAVKVEWTMRDGSVQQAWVWRSAVSIRKSR